jgi:hypothetical protein
MGRSGSSGGGEASLTLGSGSGSGMSTRSPGGPQRPSEPSPSTSPPEGADDETGGG